MVLKEIIKDKLQELYKQYDESHYLMTVNQTKWVGGYHTRKQGTLHPIRDSIDFAAAALLLEQEAYYEVAFLIIERVCEIQDTRNESKTFGLWSYYLEEDLDHMIAPDYNWSDFISKNLIGILLKCEDKLPRTLVPFIKTAIRNAAICSIKRNVAPDYTNISLMSSMTIICAGEILDNEEFINHGKERLEKLYQYTRYNGNFSEYNSSAYILVALHEIDRMMKFFTDKRCLEIAGRLNWYAWDCLMKHYNLSILQLTPPQIRAYRDVENGSLAWNIYLGTEGRFGYIPGLENISLESLTFTPKCPEECLGYTSQKKSFIHEKYYRKNNIRNAGEDATIIRDLDSPDLAAYSYLTEKYSMGVFQVMDCWNQRRNSMIIWDKEQPKYVRIRGMMNGYDFCSGIVYADQYDNVILGHTGFVTDRGSFHYILDRVKNGIYNVNELCFKFELGGETKGVTLTQSGNSFIFADGNLSVIITVYEWIFNGIQAPIILDHENKAIYLMAYQGDEKELNLHNLKESYGIYSMEVITNEDTKSLTGLSTEVKKGLITTKGYAKGKILKVKSPVHPVNFLWGTQLGSNRD